MTTHRRIAVVLAAILCFALSACTTDDAGPTCGGGCDDGDPCTVDECSDGRCHFTPTLCGTREPPADGGDEAPDASASEDAGPTDVSCACDDGNPCTIDECVDGGCDHVAASDALCGPCPTGRGDCDGHPANGCETDLTEDPDNCGVCDHPCAGECVDGLCSTE